MFDRTSLFIAYRYFISKKSTQAVSIIIYASLITLSIVTTAMFIILSVFSGLEQFNIDSFGSTSPDIKIQSASGKKLKNTTQVVETLSKNYGIQAFSKTIEEKVYVSYDGKNEIAYLKGVDANYLNVSKIDTAISVGVFPDLSDSLSGSAFGNSLMYRLNIPLDDNSIKLYMPKPGKGLITNKEAALNNTTTYVSGLFLLNEETENYIFTPISVAQKLLNTNPDEAYFVEVKLKNTTSSNKIKKELRSSLGKDYLVLDKAEQNSSFLKMMKIEQLFIILIFFLFIIIASFNLAGAIIIIIIDKKEQSKTLLSLGYSSKRLKELFFTTGIIIVLFSVIIGLILGSLITYIQAKYPIVMANEFLPFPVRFSAENYGIVAVITLAIGSIVAYISSRRVKS